MSKLVLVRHGQSTWNQENRITGWADVDLSARGVSEAREAGRRLKSDGYRFDIALASLLKRSIRTMRLILEELDQTDVPVETDWRLNERHYGSLQGLDKKYTTVEHGGKQVRHWRCGYSVRPPALDRDDPSHPRHDSRYAGVSVPDSESLCETLARVAAFYDAVCVPLLRAGRAVLIVSHSNSMRALIKHLEGISVDAIVGLDIPTAIPLVYELDASLEPVDNYYLAESQTFDVPVADVRGRARIG